MSASIPGGPGAGPGSGSGGGSANRSRSRSPKRRGGRGGGGSSSGGKGGGEPRNASGNRPSSKPGRSGTAGANQGETSRREPRPPTPEPKPAPVRPAVERHAEGNDDASAVRINRRRALVICVTPALAVGVVVGLVLALVGLPLVGVLALVVITAGLSMWLWRLAPEMVVRSIGASPSDEWEHPRLHNLVDGLCATMGLPRPTICVVQSAVPNAMAVGRDPDSAKLVVTSGLDESLTLVELEGVLAHELVHIKRNDTVVAALAVVAAVPWAVIRGSEIGADRVHTLVGRGREFSADQRAAVVVRYPPGIGSALETMVDGPASALPWPPGGGRIAPLTRWLWIDPMVGTSPGESVVGNLDDTRVRAAALSLR